MFKDINNISLKEKLAQMTQLSCENLLPDSEAAETGSQMTFTLSDKEKYSIGTTLNCIKKDEIDKIKTAFSEKKEIPLLFMADVIHGIHTIFPIPLAQASSFDFNLVRHIAQLIASQTMDEGIDVTFSPMCDLSRDPRWGRVMEGYGEDTYLAANMVRAVISGYHSMGLLSCIKHFISYSSPEGGREYNNAEISMNTLLESYLPVYKAGIDAGADLVMLSFNTYDGIPMTCNRKFVKELLRDKLKFRGVVISDYSAVRELISHDAAGNEKEAAQLALNAGIDIEMMSICFLENGESLVRNGEVNENSINVSVERILQMKKKAAEGKKFFITQRLSLTDEQIKSEAITAAAKTIILLKNKDHILPLTSDTLVYLTGPFAASRRILGGWSMGKEEGISLEEAFCQTHTITNPQSEYIVLTAGEDQETTGEGASRTELRLDREHVEYAEKKKSEGKKIILIVFAGRPLVLSDIEPYCDAILYAWFPGTYGAYAIRKIIYGEEHPQAKCPMSFPYNEGQIPVYYEQYPTGRPWDGISTSRYFSRYTDCPVAPLYPFGYGLTYADCCLENIRICNYSIKGTIKNGSNYSAVETIQLYVHKHLKGRSMRCMSLKYIEKINCCENSTNDFTIPLCKEFFITNIGGEERFVPGEFTLYIGLDSASVKPVKTSLTQEEYDALS